MLQSIVLHFHSGNTLQHIHILLTTQSQYLEREKCKWKKTNTEMMQMTRQQRL